MIDSRNKSIEWFLIDENISQLCVQVIFRKIKHILSQKKKPKQYIKLIQRKRCQTKTRSMVPL